MAENADVFFQKKKLKSGEDGENMDMNQTIPMEQFYVENKTVSQPLCKWKGPTSSASKTGESKSAMGPKSAKRAKIAGDRNAAPPVSQSKAPKLSGSSLSESE